MRECRKIGAKAVLGTVGMVVFLAAAICGYEWHCCMVEKDKLLADNNRQKMQLDAYEKKLDEYIQRLAEYERMEEERVEWLENGFSRQGGVYLIGKSGQMYELAELVAFGEEI